jgi:hypothetical protein
MGGTKSFTMVIYFISAQFLETNLYPMMLNYILANIQSNYNHRAGLMNREKYEKVNIRDVFYVSLMGKPTPLNRVVFFIITWFPPIAFAISVY